ncbi:hypothetical protein FVER53590_26561 [Fusarium verticillioides]|nr:hypothetical protein FVER53590_26561 [Fusarium verticillioides]
MGDAYLVDLHPEYHELPIIKHQVVRKELKQSADEDIESFMRELKNVALLAHLKHPNIVKLYCSYVQDMPSRRCNFIFEVAEGGSLAGLLDGRYEGPQLEAHQVLWGLADLASAIDAVHNFVSDTLDLELTGCHHDLKPQNILIQGETLVLIDFGLSTFRNPNEDSLTLFKETRGSYIAPECQSSIDGRIKSHKRLSTMASLLSEQTTQSLTGTLQCQGYFHEPTRNCFGLVYLMPTTNLTPRTLYQLIDEMVPEKKKPRFRPPLEYRFRLVSDLCRSVQTLHKINWLHRNIHSMNVICLSPPGVRDAEAAQNMRLIGLGASREDTHDSFTQGHDEEAQLRNYQHPSYLGGARYRAEFDCYSLGMVLLEIGLWSTLSRLGKGFKGMDDEAFRRNIIQKYVPQLEMTMGSNYMEAVRWCVEGEPVSTPHQGSRPQSLEEMVMGRLHVL